MARSLIIDRFIFTEVAAAVEWENTQQDQDSLAIHPIFGVSESQAL